jgi:hypothetical protein
MLINQTLKLEIEKQYQNMKPNEDVFTFQTGLLKNLSIFVDKKPNYVLWEFSDERNNKKIYLGSETK